MLVFWTIRKWPFCNGRQHDVGMFEFKIACWSMADG
jgi:hypothetical protein